MMGRAISIYEIRVKVAWEVWNLWNKAKKICEENYNIVSNAECMKKILKTFLREEEDRIKFS